MVGGQFDSNGGPEYPDCHSWIDVAIVADAILSANVSALLVTITQTFFDRCEIFGGLTLHLLLLCLC